jgi:hypothetical protein
MGVAWNVLGQDTDRWQAVVNAVMTLLLSLNTRSLLLVKEEYLYEFVSQSDQRRQCRQSEEYFEFWETEYDCLKWGADRTGTSQQDGS